MDNLWSFMILAFGSGLAALLTPCVFPMIPLTVSFFSKKNNNPKEVSPLLENGIGNEKLLYILAMLFMTLLFYLTSKYGKL
jgi:cytochrome c biogenesis protein CcdA